MLGSDKVTAVLADLGSAPIGEALRAMLAFLGKLTRDHASVTADDVTALFALGITRAQVEDALAVAWAFNVITRLADTFAFAIPPQSGFDVSAKMLLTRGYDL